jgi:hypothetical protein
MTDGDPATASVVAVTAVVIVVEETASPATEPTGAPAPPAGDAKPVVGRAMAGEAPLACALSSRIRRTWPGPFGRVKLLAQQVEKLHTLLLV